MYSNSPAFRCGATVINPLNPGPPSQPVPALPAPATVTPIRPPPRLPRSGPRPPPPPQPPQFQPAPSLSIGQQTSPQQDTDPFASPLQDIPRRPGPVTGSPFVPRGEASVSQSDDGMPGFYMDADLESSAASDRFSNMSLDSTPLPPHTRPQSSPLNQRRPSSSARPPIPRNSPHSGFSPSISGL
jgi:hypothetical protein